MRRIRKARKPHAIGATAALLISLALTAPPSWAGFDEGMAAFKRKDYPHAFLEWRAAAERGDARAQFQLAILYEQGLGTSKDIPEALKWARLAADNGEANAQFALSVLSADGREVAKDQDEAAKWFRRGAASAEGGDATAQYLLSKMYEIGRGVERDDVKALTWTQFAGQHFCGRLPDGTDDLISADPLLHPKISFAYAIQQQIAHAFPVFATVKRRLLPYIRPSHAAHAVGCWPW